MADWRCKNGHTIGQVMEYGAFNCLRLVNERGETIAVISGSAEVRCSVCGEVRSWFASATVKIRVRQVLA